MLRYIVIVMAALLIMVCSGSVYAWSIFVQPLQAEYGLTATDTQLIFGGIIGCFTLVMLFVDRVRRRVGTKLSVAIGAVLFSAGYLVASFSGGNLGWLLLGISVLSGAGMAFGYVTVLPTLVKWFPNRKGLASGIAVAGFGGGAIIMSQIARPLLAEGLGVLEIFRYIGIIYGLLLLVGALVFSAPKNGDAAADNATFNLGEMLRDRRFWVLCFTFFTGTFAGMLFIGSLAPIGLSAGVTGGAAVLAISLLSIGNALGRVVWGQIHDMIGGRRSVGIALSVLAGLTLLLLLGNYGDVGFLVLALAIGLFFGANFVLYASDVSDFYGIYQLGTIYPIVSLAYGVSGIVAPVVGGYLYDATQSYYIALVISAAVCLTGVAAYLLLMPRRPSRA